jgi:putative transposase
MANRTYLYITIPKPLQNNPDIRIKEARLVYNQQACRYDWNLVIEDGLEPPRVETEVVMGVDLGEIHPAVCSTKTEGFVVSCRELRSAIQHRNKCLAELSRAMSKCTKGSRRWHKLRRAKIKRRGYFANKIRDLEHKVSRLVVNEAVGLGVSMIGLGDVRNIGDGKKLGKKSQQKISQWTHGNIRRYIEYKAARMGIQTTLVNEAYTTQTCPECGERHKPTGRVYSCPSCGFVGHRDVVGASNILARLEAGDVGGIYPEKLSYRHAHNCRKNQKVSGVGASSGPCERVHVAWEQLSLL